ncbi:MAG: transcription-repair coupling factor [Planctomycetota bacterium]|nr:transcription-repair coupling factor [Planctomycetota bacterium]
MPTELDSLCADWLRDHARPLEQMLAIPGQYEVGGLAGSAAAWLVSAAFLRTRRSCLVITRTHEAAEDLAAEVATFAGRQCEVIVFPESGHTVGGKQPPKSPSAKGDFLPQDAAPALLETATAEPGLGLAARLRALVRLLQLGTDSRCVLIASIRAVLERVPGRQAIEDAALALKTGQTMKMSALADLFVRKGLERTPSVEVEGQFAIRGGIIDLFPLGDACPVRVEFAGDRIESIRLFDPGTQVSSEKKQSYETFLVGRTELTNAAATAGAALKQDALSRDTAGSPRQSDSAGRPSACHSEPGSESPCPVVEEMPRPLSGHDRKNVFSTGSRSGTRPQAVFVTNHLGPNAWTAFIDKPALLDHARRVLTHEGIEETGLLIMEFLHSLAATASVSLHELPVGRSFRELPPESQGQGRDPRFRGGPSAKEDLPATVPGAFNVRATTVQRLSGNLTDLSAELIALAGPAGTAYVVCDNEAAVQRFLELIKGGAAGGPEEAERRKSRIRAVIGFIAVGFALTDAGISVLSQSEVLNRYRFKRRLGDVSHARPTDEFLSFKKGDFVVHENHGVARYLGVEKLKKEGRMTEFLVLEYQGHEKLFVPAHQANLVQRYLGSHGGDFAPALGKLGGIVWERKKARVATAVEKLAHELLDVHAARELERGTAFPKDSRWQHEFEAAFPFEDTEDQVMVTAAIKKDMESPRPMDRLICGDVGFGKTELAMRAAFKAATAGRQTAVLVPTTVLAQQHYINFRDRMAQFPMVIEVLSRFRSRTEQADVLRRLEAGTVDIIIGTHRLLQKDVRIMNLGLVIIDEEQRFGVEHKEILKRLRATVDVLTLTATPIPRTLHMSLLGLRDISTLSTPPQDRRSIRTEVCRMDPEVVRQAILLELDRGGQVFFLHNRVYDVDSVAARLASIVPEARFSVAHGQMPEHLLEQRMLDFIERRSDVLVSTTIIESGLDIPNANTIFVHNADMFGLADLHQLRGRVGRYKNQAFAYFLLPENRTIAPEAAKRLQAIHEFNELGAGFKIAMRDLEIRGTGNLLGREQSGHIAAVGYELYCRLLQAAVKTVRNEPVPRRMDACVDLRVDAFMPASYIGDEDERIQTYFQISRIGSLAELRDFERRLADRYGRLARSATPVHRLLELAELRVMAHSMGVSLLVQGDEAVTFKFESAAACSVFHRSHARRTRQVDPITLLVPFDPEQPGAEEKVIRLVKGMLQKGA